MDAMPIIAILLIGFSTGLRSFTSSAVLAWAADLGRLSVGATLFSFMASPITAGVLTLFALGEYVADLLPKTPSRTAAVGLIARFIMGTFAAGCIAAVSGRSLVLGLLGGITAIGGAFAGYYARTGLVKSLNVKDPLIAIPEDIAAVILAVASVYLISA